MIMEPQQPVHIQMTRRIMDSLAAFEVLSMNRKAVSRRDHAATEG